MLLLRVILIFSDIKDYLLSISDDLNSSPVDIFKNLCEEGSSISSDICLTTTLGNKSIYYNTYSLLEFGVT